MDILLLDDEPLELEQLELLINKHFPSWVIEKAYNGKQALQKVKERAKAGMDLQLALVDIKIPGEKNGLEVAKQIKELMPNLDIIVVSAFQEFEYAKKVNQPKSAGLSRETDY